MRTSESTASVFAALAVAQSALTHASKGAENPAFKRDGKSLKYADLSDHWTALRPVLKANDLAVVQELLSAEHGVEVVTRIVHKSGEWLECGPLFVPASKNDAHGYGSACSYARRYALSAALGTVADDDDGNAATESKTATVPEPIGYQDWLADMQALAATVPELRVFRDSYKSSSAKHRAYLESTNKAGLDAMVETAKGNEQALLAGAGK